MKELRSMFVNLDFTNSTPEHVAHVCGKIQQHPEFKASSALHVFYTQMLVQAIKSGNVESFNHVCALNCPGLKDDFNYPIDIIHALQGSRNPQMRGVFLQFLGQCSEDMQNIFARCCFGGEQYKTMLDDVVQQPQSFDVYRAFARSAIVDGSVNYALSVAKVYPEVLSALRNRGSGAFYNRRLEHVEEQYEQWFAQRQKDVLHHAIDGSHLNKKTRKI